MKRLGNATLIATLLAAFSMSAHAVDVKQEHSGGTVTSDQPSGEAAGGYHRPGSAEAAGWPTFSAVDKDGNGLIDQNEASGVAGLNFISADGDSDGRLNRTEYEAAKRGAPAMRGEGSGGSPVGPSGGAGQSSERSKSTR